MSTGQRSDERAEQSRPDAGQPGPDAPVLRVVRGRPTPDELAAVVAVLSSLGGPVAPADGPEPSTWGDPSRRLVGPSATRGGWRTAALPR